MTVATIHQHPATDVAVHPGAVSLVAWAQEADAASHLADTLCRSMFVPAQFRGKPVEATAAILAGSEIGLSPMAALQAFDIIDGRAAPRAITHRAVAQANGHEIVMAESTDEKCVMRGRRRGNEEWQQVTWTMTRARKLGLADKRNWKSQPQAMLVARATSEIARLVASDALMGIPYSVEELRDDEASEEAPARRSVGSKPRAKAPAPALPDETPADAEEAPATATPSDLRRLGSAMTEAGITAKDARLAVAREVIGRDIAAAQEMTADEVDRVIEALEQPVAEAEMLPVQDPPEFDASVMDGFGQGGGEA